MEERAAVLGLALEACSHTQGPVRALGLVLYCPGLEILNDLEQGPPCFPLVLGPEIP